MFLSVREAFGRRRVGFLAVVFREDAVAARVEDDECGYGVESYPSSLFFRFRDETSVSEGGEDEERNVNVRRQEIELRKLLKIFEWSGGAAFAICPSDVACWPPVGREAREETNSLRIRVNRHVRTYPGDRIA